jgi:hypothetical protein
LANGVAHRSKTDIKIVRCHAVSKLLKGSEGDDGLATLGMMERHA